MPDDPDTLPTTDGVGLLNLSPKGKAPESRIKDYSSAVGIVRQAIDDAEYERQDRVNEQALLDGQGPFIQEDLDRAGLSWCQNNDYGGASSKSEQAQAPYGELFNGFTVEFDDTIQGAQRSEYAARIAESWSVLHARFWEEHYTEDQNLTRLSVNFGVAVADFEHPRDWRWRSGGLDEHFFPRPMRPYPNDADWHIRVRPYRPVQLQAWLDNPNAEKVGFNKDAIKKAIEACNRSSNYGDRDDTTNNLFARSYSSKNAFVRLFTMRVVEFTETGKQVSECMGMTDGRGEDFIYRSKKPDWQDSMSNCFVLFTSGIGNGDLHSIKGLASKVFPTEQTINQFINKMYDSARLNMSPVFECASDSDRKKVNDITWGSFANVLPYGLTPAKSLFPSYTSEVLNLINYSGGIGQRNTGVYQPELTPASVEQTREEVITRTMNNGVITSRALDLYQEAKERQYNLSLKRLQRKDYNKNDPGFKERKMFFDDMQQRGVDNPQEVFSHVTYIKPNRQVGGGSAAGGQMLLEKAAAMRGYLDPVAQKVLDEMVLTRLLGSQNAKILIPQIDIQRTTNQQHNAITENKFFLTEGLPQDVLPDDDHFAHAQIHDAYLPQVYLQLGVTQLQPGQSTDDLQPQIKAKFGQFLNAFIPHQQNHLSALGSNKQQSREIGQFAANLNKARQFQQHLMASAYNEQARLLEAARAQSAKEAQDPALNQGATGPNSDQQKVAAKAALAQIEIGKQSQLATIEINKQAAANAAQLNHANAKQAQARAFDDADNANELLQSAKQPLPNPVIQP